MSLVSSIFKAYDIRGKVGSELNVESVKNIGQAFGQWLPLEGTVAVGRDMRPDSEELSRAIIDGLRLSGRDVWDIGEVTSDMIYFVTGHYDLAGGAMITASHNPGDYNGIKLCREEAKPVGEESGLFEIRDMIEKRDFGPSKTRGSVVSKDVVEDWIDHVLTFIEADKLKPLKIAIDAGNGMAGKIFPELEPYVPFEVEELYFELDGTFPNHIANPLEPKNLIDLQAAVLKGKCNAGIAFDGDGDRAVIIDEKGEPLTGTVMTALLSEYFLGKYPGSTILLNAICGQAAVEAIARLGGKSVRTRVGHSFIKNDMRKHKAIFAGEHSGHYYFKDNFMADSGLIAAVVTLAVLSDSGKKLSDLVKPLRSKYFQIPETNFEVNDKDAAMNRVSKDFADNEQDWLDGLTIKLGDGWVNVRPSNTEPLLRLNAESTSKAYLDKIVLRVSEVIRHA